MHPQVAATHKNRKTYVTLTFEYDLEIQYVSRGCQRHMFWQNVIKLSAVVHELSCCL